MKLSILYWSAAFLVALAGVPTPAAAMPITLLSPNPVEHERFGTSVAVVGDKVVVGAPGSGFGAGLTLPGAAYVFEAGTGALLYTIPNPTPAANDQFGLAVSAIGTNKILISAPRYDISAAPAGGCPAPC